jgi:hypothetical protein
MSRALRCRRRADERERFMNGRFLRLIAVGILVVGWIVAGCRSGHPAVTSPNVPPESGAGGTDSAVAAVPRNTEPNVSGGQSAEGAGGAFVEGDPLCEKLAPCRYPSACGSEGDCYRIAKCGHSVCTTFEYACAMDCPNRGPCSLLKSNPPAIGCARD